MLPIVETANMARTITKTKPVSVNIFHKQVGHPNMAVTRSTAKARGLKLIGTVEPVRVAR